MACRPVDSDPSLPVVRPDSSSVILSECCRMQRTSRLMLGDLNSPAILTIYRRPTEVELHLVVNPIYTSLRQSTVQGLHFCTCFTRSQVMVGSISRPLSPHSSLKRVVHIQSHQSHLSPSSISIRKHLKASLPRTRMRPWATDVPEEQRELGALTRSLARRSNSLLSILTAGHC